MLYTHLFKHRHTTHTSTHIFDIIRFAWRRQQKVARSLAIVSNEIDYASRKGFGARGTARFVYMGVLVRLMCDGGICHQ